MAEILNFKVQDGGMYQTISFDGDRPSWYETHLRTAEDLGRISASAEPTDFRVVDGLLMAAPNLGTVSVCADPSRYEFKTSLVDLLRWLVEQEALIELEDGNQFKAISMRVSSSTMTVSAPYVKEDEWRSFNFIKMEEYSLVGSRFDFVVSSEVPERFGLGEGKKIRMDGRDCWRYAYRDSLLVAPMMEGSYLLSKAMLHYFASKADLFMRIKDVLRVFEKHALALAGISGAEVKSGGGEYKSRTVKTGISVKREGAPAEDARLVFDAFYRRYLKDGGWSYEQVCEDVKANSSVQWLRMVRLLLADMFFKYKQPEDRLQYLSGMLRLLAKKELMQRLALYEHRAYIYVNDVPFLEDSLEVPLDRLFLYGGSSKDCYVLKRE